MATAVGTYSGGQRASVFISAILGFALDGYNLLIISFLMPALEATLHINLVEAGVISSVQLIAAVVGGVLFGWIGDAIGRKNSLMGSILLYTIGAVLSGLSWNYGALLVFRFITGIGLGGEWGAGMVLFNEVWNPKRRGLGSSVIQASFLAGISLAGVVAQWALHSFGPTGWHAAFYTGVIPILLVIFIRFVMPESHLWAEYDRLRKNGQLPPEKARESAPIAEIFKGAALKYTMIGLLMVAGYMFAFYSVTTFMPTFMIKAGHMAPALVSPLTTTILWIAIPCYILAGWISDSWGRKIAFAIPAVLEIVGFIWLYLVGKAGIAFPGGFGAWAVFWAYLLFYVGSGAATMFGPWFSEIFPTELRATAVSFCYMVGRASSALAPVLVPVVAAASAKGLQGGMSIGLVGAVLLVVLGLFLPETLGKQFRVIDRVGVVREASN